MGIPKCYSSKYLLFFCSASLESMCESAQIIVKLRPVRMRLYSTLTALHVTFKDYDQKQAWKIRTFSFCTSSSGCFCCMAILCTQNKSVRIRIMINFNILLDCGVCQVLQECTHEMYSCLWDWDSIFETEKRRNHSSISDCMTAPKESSGIYNKYVLFLWKHQVSLILVF